MSFGPSAVIIRPANSTPENGVPRLGHAAHASARRSRPWSRSIIAGVIDRRRRIGAHAAGVRAGVAVADALVVLRGAEAAAAVVAVAEAEEARLLAVEEFLDHHLRAGRAEGAVEAVVDRGQRLGLASSRR